MKTIDTLVEDIYAVVSGNGGWDETVNEYFKGNLGDTMMSRLSPKTEYPKGTLRMSSIGQPCERKLWYSVNQSDTAEELREATQLKFLYGDILEELLLALAVAAGHTVEGRQDTMDIMGIKGHRDAVIDGVTVDVKSASTYSFKKFKEHRLEDEDPFGYMWQLGAYTYCGKDDPLVKDKENGAFLVIDKQHGTLCLDTYNFKKLGYLDDMEGMYESRIKTSGDSKAPPRGFPTEADGKSGNRKLGVNCSYCGFKHECYPTLRTFLYGRGPVFLTTVKREPKVPEV